MAPIKLIALMIAPILEVHSFHWLSGCANSWSCIPQSVIIILLCHNHGCYYFRLEYVKPIGWVVPAHAINLVFYVIIINITFCLVTGTPLERAPKLTELLDKVAAKTRDKWRMVGLQLNIEPNQLTAISRSHQDAMNCYREVFTLWENKCDPPFTWATIIDALRASSVGEDRLALELERWLRQDI